MWVRPRPEIVLQNSAIYYAMSHSVELILQGKANFFAMGKYDRVMVAEKYFYFILFNFYTCIQHSDVNRSIKIRIMLEAIVD